MTKYERNEFSRARKYSNNGKKGKQQIHCVVCVIHPNYEVNNKLKLGM
jgi:hypothetical protein